MKITIICYSHFDATISLGKYLKLLNSEIKVHFIFLLSQSFLDVEILNLQRSGLANGFVNQKEINKVVDKEVINYLEGYATFDIFIFNSYTIADKKNFKLLFQLKSAIKEKGYDVLHFVGNNPWIIFLNALFTKAPKVHTLHEPYPFRKPSYYRLLRHKLKVKLLIRTGSYIILPSEISYQRFITHFCGKSGNFGILPFGPLEVYRMYSTDTITKDDSTILYYGIISPYKGIEVLIAAMQQIVKVNSNLKLIIAGMGDFNHAAKEQVKNLTVINRYLSNIEIANLNQKAAVVVCPYTSASQSGVVMTSFAFNNPIVATNVGALAEFVEDGVTGIIIPPNDAEALCRALLKLFADKDAITKMRSRVQQKYLYSEVSWPRIAEQTFNIYKQQIEKKRDYK